MKTKKQTSPTRKATRIVAETPITDSTRKEIGRKISRSLDLMNDPRFKDESFVQIEEKGIRSYILGASSSEVSIYFSIEWKGGQS